MEWISVKERLPTKEHREIVCLINKRPIPCLVHDATLSFSLNSLSYHWPTRQWIKDKYFAEVTHWMPLPEPPEN